MAREQTRLQFGKYNGDECWGGDLDVLGRDSHGLWLGGRVLPTDSSEQPDRGKGRAKPAPKGIWVALIPDDAWWVARFYAKSLRDVVSDVVCRVDITTPTTVNEGEAFTLDLDLRVLKTAGGDITLVGEDELERHAQQMSYPPRLIAAAREAAGLIQTKLTAGEAPFDGSHESWLRQV